MPTTSAENSVETTAQDTGTTPPEDNPTPTTANAEAAKYRRRLRDAEAERDQLAAKVVEFETAEQEAIITAAKAEHASRIGFPHLAEHLTGDDVEQITADADRAQTIITTALAAHYHPDTGVLAQAGALLEDQGIEPHAGGFTLAGAAQLFSQLPDILEADNPGRDLEEILKVALPARSGPFVPRHMDGVRRQVSRGDIPSGLSVGEAMRNML